MSATHTSASITISAWTTTLADGEYASSADTGALTAENATFTGVIETGASATTGGYFSLYWATLRDTSDYAGSIDTGLGAGAEELDDTDFILDNLKFLGKFVADQASKGFQFETYSLLSVLGKMPEQGVVIIFNKTGGALAAGSELEIQKVNE